jgi:hypothetical protein
MANQNVRKSPAVDVKPAYFAHAVLKTSQFEAMVKHWQTLLNAELVYSNELLCFMTFDHEHHRLAIINQPGLETHSDTSPGLDHLAYTYSGIDDLMVTYERLKGLGIAPFWCINHGPTLSLYYKDPDGNKAELQIDVFDTIEATNIFLSSGAFSANPIGIEFDPDVLFEAYRSGESLTELTRRRELNSGESFFDHLKA